MKCPRDQAALAQERYEADIQIDRCPTCDGIWLDEGELEAIQEHKEKDWSKELAKMEGILRDAGLAQEMAKQKARAPALCPKCRAEMVAEEYAYCSQILVDICPKGCGVWLDKGELAALEVFFERNKKKANDEVTAAPNPHDDKLSDDIVFRMRSVWASLRHALAGKKR